MSRNPYISIAIIGRSPVHWQRMIPNLNTNKTYREHEQNEICKKVDLKKNSYGSVPFPGSRDPCLPSNPHDDLTMQVNLRITLH